MVQTKSAATYVVFEGGGAKGLAHLGVLEAVETYHRIFEVRGFAGTSAGAIIASLAAAGYSSKELVDFDRKKSLLQSLTGRPTTPSDVIGPGWGAIKAFRSGAREGPFVRRLWGWTRTIGNALIARRRGLAKLHRFRKHMQEALDLKLGLGRDVTFRDLVAAGKPDLKVVSANLSRGELWLFSYVTTPEVPVADAVAASVAIPFVFEPWRVRQGSEIYDHADGGLVSNLPAWAFDEARILNREAMTILSRVKEDPKFPTLIPVGSWSWLPRSLRAAAFGGSSLNLRNIGRTTTIDLIPGLRLLDFDAPVEEFARAINDARLVAEGTIELELSVLRWVQGVREDAAKVLRSEGFDGGSLRIALAVPLMGDVGTNSESEDVLQLKYCVGYDHASDYRLSLPRSSFVGEILKLGKAAFVDAATLRDLPDPLEHPEYRGIFAMIPSTIAWRFVVPLKSRGNVFPYSRFAVCIDGTETLDTSDKKLSGALHTIEHIIHNRMPVKIA